MSKWTKAPPSEPGMSGWTTAPPTEPGVWWARLDDRPERPWPVVVEDEYGRLRVSSPWAGAAWLDDYHRDGMEWLRVDNNPLFPEDR